jgi:elongation factor Ts
MPEVTAEAVRSLRDRTDLPMMECKRALIEANGDEDAAVRILKERVKGFKEKSKDRSTNEGRVASMTAADGSAAVLVEVQCESAPVAKAEDFVFLCEQACKQLLTGPGAATPDELLSQKCPDKPNQTIGELLDDVMNKIRERIVIARIEKKAGPVASYTHHDGTLGVLMWATGTAKNTDVLRDVAMQVAALKPVACLPEELDPAIIARERARLMEEAKASGKPEAVVEKMVEGRVRMFLANEGVLVEQPFVKDEKKTVSQVLAEAGLKAGGFQRWRLGQP